MKTRRVFSAPDVATAEAALRQAVRLGIRPEHAALVGRPEIEVDQIPDAEKETSPTDFKPAAVRGLVGGAVLGLVVGLVGMAVPAAGIPLAGVVLCTVVGACVGMWAASLAGSAVPNKVRRDYRHEIDAGLVLLVIEDEDEHLLDRVGRALEQTRLRRLEVMPHGLLQ